MRMHASRIVGLMVLLGLFAAPAAQDALGPPPGRLIDVGGRRLHLWCMGSGSPTVLFEAGASAFAIDFSLVQPEIAKPTLKRRCASSLTCARSSRRLARRGRSS